MFSFLRLSLLSINSERKYLTLFRYARNASRRGAVLKTLKDYQVKNIEDDYEAPIDMEEMKKRIRENDLDIEETFAKGEDFETVISESFKLYDIHKSEEKHTKKHIKKSIIARKFFKAGKETSLLTYAAKEQIKYLHEFDPTEWNPETISKSFPISVEGVKKLLKSNFVLQCPEKIKIHDEFVMKKWEALESGKTSDLISFHTQCLWNAGKLLKQNYNGNPNLPKVPSNRSQKITELKKLKPIGEYSAIVQKYVEYKSQRETKDNKNSELLVKSDVTGKKNKKETVNSSFDASKFVRKSKIFKEDGDLIYNKGNRDELELPFSQFKENLKQQSSFEGRKSSSSKQYYEWIVEESKETQNVDKKFSFDTNNFIPKISKYNKENVELKRDRTNSENSLYMYSDKLGYQFPKGSIIKGKIKIPFKSGKKGTTYKVGKSIYDENGEFLYKLPG